MKPLPREHRELVERVLREYPLRENEFKALDATIVSLCRAPSILRIGREGGVACSAQEKILEAKENNQHYKSLEQYIIVVRKGLRLLDGQEREILSMFFWEGFTNAEIAEKFSLQKRWVLKLKSKALYKLSQVFIPHFMA